ncbi:hypothetical protein Lepto7376_1990 [[Leptolyngbya] sp. PCC 7376]|uniref:hypothetical protein n=1 Tax=[Leptolyngbya] sp. PCC 7376 TaxID=111781 RepID=UPI00029F4B58|nr:hypothetical protein [[Leptolyngbya] sp. PCC 7376]AFY38300.1 hypothetical protein Lepto7376_1990 [[Leptolyngbya] sp. PCC 7376]
MRTQYITTDLELESPNDLTSIVQEFEDDVLVHFCGAVGDRHAASFGLFHEGSVASDINFYCNLIENLSESSRMLWDSCTRIDFNIGYEAGDEPKSWRSPISTEVLERITKNRGDIVITIYPHGIYSSVDTI